MCIANKGSAVNAGFLLNEMRLLCRQKRDGGTMVQERLYVVV